MRLKYQLFIALLLASALLILLMYVISSWSFSRGLLEYVNQNTHQNAKALVTELELLHEQRQSWEWAKGRSPEWHKLIRATNPRDDNGPRDIGPSGKPPPKGRRAPRYVLADAMKNIVTGPQDRDSDIQWMEINGPTEVVGYLGFRNLVRLDSQLDRAFESQQKKSFAYAGVGLVLLSALLAVPMASLLLKPLLRIGDVVENIRQGDYHKRVAFHRRDELGALAQDIDLLAQTLENNRDARQRWIAEISHELRTPMSVMRAELEAMQDGIRPLNPAAVESLHYEVMGLNRLVDDLHTLSLSDIGALDYRFETLQLESVLTTFLDNNVSGFADASLTINTQFESLQDTILADSQRLQQLLSNLYQNSVRYTDAEGMVTVKTHNVDENTLQLLWSDSSPGVPTEALPKLFDPLYRVEQSRNRAFGGAGLGLSIVSRIVQAHNGTVSASHASEGGLEIDIRLPLATTEG